MSLSPIAKIAKHHKATLKLKAEITEHLDGVGSISTSHLLVLNYISKVPQTVIKIGDYLGITGAATTQKLATMEGAGLIKRTPDKNDKRKKYISPTAKGSKELAKLS